MKLLRRNTVYFFLILLFFSPQSVLAVGNEIGTSSTGSDTSVLDNPQNIDDSAVSTDMGNESNSVIVGFDDAETVSSGGESVDAEIVSSGSESVDTETFSQDGASVGTNDGIDTSITVKESSVRSGENEVVFPPDQRIRVANTTESPYRQTVFIVAYFDKAGPRVGSGVLIAPNKVLTAAHVVRFQETGEWASRVAVSPAKSGDSYPYGIIKGSKYHLFSDYKHTYRFEDDLAVITLDSSFPSYVGHLDISTSVATNQRMRDIGYPATNEPEDVGKIGYMYTGTGPVLRLTNELIYHRVDTTGGHSGGPILDSQNRIIGVHVGGQKTVYNYARRINGDAVNVINLAKSDSDSSGRTLKIVTTYRLYNIASHYHLYTTSGLERDTLAAHGWRYEGVAWWAN